MIKGLTFDTSGLFLLESSDEKVVWGNHKDNPVDLLTLDFYPVEPNIPCAMNDIDALRIAYRDLAIRSQMGLISVDLVALETIPTVEAIFKSPQMPTGMTYIGMLTLPFLDFSFVLKAECCEYGITGFRDSAVFSTQDIDTGTDPMKDWAKDPYDPSLNYQLMRNKSEDEKYDADFPDHPLSRLRRLHKTIKHTCKLEKAVSKAPLFTGPQS